jgi:tRNA threonylcarbamoyladenosine biosynthesis protein TsaB
VRVLGFDTATRATTVAVWDTGTGVAHERRDDPPVGARPRHTTRLLALVLDALRAAQTDWAGIDLIAVGTGPGTFTGLRIGIATARARAAARALPIVGVSTLHALASGAGAGETSRHRLAVLDARRGEAFAAGWSSAEVRDPRARARIAPCALAPAELARTLSESGQSWLAVGEGAVAFRAELAPAGVDVPGDGCDLHRVTATEVCRLALGLPPGRVEDVRPEYLRLPDAELSRRAAQTPSR